jgi:glycosyltransferase involved in cell wall biosynthesis
MIRLLHMLWDARLGGIQQLLLDLLPKQNARAGLKADVLFMNGRGPNLPAFQQEEWRTYTLGFRNGYDFSPAKRAALRAHLRPYDVLHLHDFNPWMAREAARSGKKIIYTEHGNFGFGRTRRVGEWVNQSLQGSFQRRRVDLITYNSLFSKGVAESRYRTQQRPSVLIYNGSDIDLIQSQAKAHPVSAEPGTFLVGTTSRLAGGKRIERLLRTFALFAASHPDARLCIVGDGPEKARLEAEAGALGLPSKQLFLGEKNPAAPYQAAMDLCVYPFYNEAFGLVALESLALGKPTLVFSDSGGMREVVEMLSREDVCEDEAALLRRMEYYYLHREEAARQSEVRKAFARRFHIDEMEAQLYTAYLNLLPH